MCALCRSYEQQLKQFQRALTQPLDELSKQRITSALHDIEATKPSCTDELAESKIVDFQLRRITTALDALSRADLEGLVREIELEVGQDNNGDTWRDQNASDE
jgi:hypothetical protein